jgi:L-fuculose-phosphate aldolase
MVADGLVIGSAGNVSARAPGAARRLVASPAGVPYERLRAADYPVVDLDTGTARGPLRPTSELPLHLEIMREMPDVTAIVHTHSRCATAFAVARRDIPFVCNENLGPATGRVLVSRPYAVPSTSDLARIAVATFRRAPGSKAILLANHGVVALGPTLDAAYLVAAQVEWVAAVCLGARQLGGEHVLRRSQQEAMARAYGVELALER